MTSQTTAIQAIRDFLAARDSAAAAHYDVAAPTAEMRNALSALRSVVDADECAKLDAAIIKDLTWSEFEAIIGLRVGVVDIDAIDAKGLRLAGLVRGEGDDIELTDRGTRIAETLHGA